MTVIEVLWILVVLVLAVSLWLGAQADAATRELRARRKSSCQKNHDGGSAGGRKL